MASPKDTEYWQNRKEKSKKNGKGKTVDRIRKAFARNLVVIGWMHRSLAETEKYLMRSRERTETQCGQTG